MKTSSYMPRHDRRRRVGSEVVVACLITISTIVVPLVMGEFYPFTNVPMFRDNPREYTDIEIRGADGVELELRAFELQRNYDGKPPGNGAGYAPPASMYQWGRRMSTDEIYQHVQQKLECCFPSLDYVIVKIRVIGEKNAGRIGIVDERIIRVPKS